MATLKCLNCDELSPPGSASCIHCGRATLYSRDKGQRNSQAKEATNRAQLALIFIVVGWVMVWFSWSQAADKRELYARCTATATAVLNPAYVQVKTTKLGITTSTRYKVTYTFPVAGQQVFGQDSIEREPKALAMAVHFNPKDPTESYLEKRAIWPVVVAFIFAIGMTWLGVFLLRGGGKPRPA